MLPAYPVLFQIKVIVKNLLLLDCSAYHCITGLSETVPIPVAAMSHTHCKY